MAKRIITFGEIMLRLNPEGYRRFVQANVFEASYAGGEANVAVSLANYGMDAAFVTKVPAHEIGQAAVNALRTYGVDTKNITLHSLRENIGVVAQDVYLFSGSVKENIAYGKIFCNFTHGRFVSFHKAQKNIMQFHRIISTTVNHSGKFIPFHREIVIIQW